MKILDIIADDSLNEAGILSRLGIGVVDKYLEKKAAEQALAAIEKKYANDIVRQKAAKDVAERYAKLLADAEAAGTPRIKSGLLDLENLLKDAAKNPNHPTLRNNRYYEDTNFLKMVDDLAEARKTQMVRDIQNPPAPPKEKKPKDEKPKDEPSKVTKARVVETDDIVDKTKKGTLSVKNWITILAGLAQAGLGIDGWLRGIEYEHSKDLKTNEANLNKGELSPGDDRFFPPVVTEGTPVSSIGEAFYFKDGQKQFYVYDTALKRLLAGKAWRDAKANQLVRSQRIMFFASWGFTSALSAAGLGLAGKLGMFSRFTKAFGSVSKDNMWMQLPSHTIEVAIAGLSTYAKDKLARTMSSVDMNEAMGKLILTDTSTWGPVVSQTGDNIDQSLEGHDWAAKTIAKIALGIGEILGIGVEPRTAPKQPVVNPNIPAANPSEKDPSQKGKQVDQTDSNGTTPAPVAKPEEKTKKQDAPNIPSEDNTAAGRGAKFTQAKDAGVATVVIGGKTYKTADFVDDGGYWTHPTTGESFVKN